MLVSAYPWENLVKGPGLVSCSSLSFSSLDLNNSLNIMPSLSLHWYEVSRDKTEKTAERQGAEREQRKDSELAD